MDLSLSIEPMDATHLHGQLIFGLGLDRAKTLYVCEDHILASLPALLAAFQLDEESEADQRGSADSAQRRDLTELMRQLNLTITCDVAGWTVETTDAADDLMSG